MLPPGKKDTVYLVIASRRYIFAALNSRNAMTPAIGTSQPAGTL